jgi:hypothetical protein
MIEALLTKSITIWLDVSIAIWAIVYRNDIVAILKDLFGGYGGKPPKDDDKPKEDK